MARIPDAARHVRLRQRMAHPECHGPLPLGWDRAGDSEVFYTELGFPVGRDLYLSAMSTYNIKTHNVSEVAYRLILDHDCSRWEFIFRDDHLAKNDDWMTLRFMVKAFPETPLAFGDKSSRIPSPTRANSRGKSLKAFRPAGRSWKMTGATTA